MYLRDYRFEWGSQIRFVCFRPYDGKNHQYAETVNVQAVMDGALKSGSVIASLRKNSVIFLEERVAF